MKVFHIAIDVTSTVSESCDVFVEAETLEKAIEKFEENPDDYEWDNWEHQDTDVRNWKVDKKNSDRIKTLNVEKKTK